MTLGRRVARLEACNGRFAVAMPTLEVVDRNRVKFCWSVNGKPWGESSEFTRNGVEALDAFHNRAAQEFEDQSASELEKHTAIIGWQDRFL